MAVFTAFGASLVNEIRGNSYSNEVVTDRMQWPVRYPVRLRSHYVRIEAPAPGQCCSLATD
jgi:hypothetical protein